MGRYLTKSICFISDASASIPLWMLFINGESTFTLKFTSPFILDVYAMRLLLENIYHIITFPRKVNVQVRLFYFICTQNKTECPFVHTSRICHLLNIFIVPFLASFPKLFQIFLSELLL